MQVKQYSPELNPELFFLPRDTGEVRPVYDDDGTQVGTEPVLAYDLPHELLATDYGFVARRRCTGGRTQEMRCYPEHAELWIVDDPDAGEIHVCDIQIEAQRLNFDLNDWEPIDLTGVQLTTGFSEVGFWYQWEWDTLDGYWIRVNQAWTLGNPKGTFIVESPDSAERVRIQATIDVINEVDELIVDYSDASQYDTVSDEMVYDEVLGREIRRIVFSPDGEVGQSVIDPYIEVDEQSSYVDVECDGFVLRVNSAVGSDSIQVRDTSGNEWHDVRFQLRASSTNYYLHYAAPTLAVLESTPTRVILKLVGNLDSTYGGGTPLANADPIEVLLYVYPDRFVCHVKLVTTDTVTLDNSSQNCFFGLFGTAANITNEDGIVESGSSEISAVDFTEYTDADYLGVVADEVDIMYIVLNTMLAGTAVFRQYFSSDTSMSSGPNNGTLTVGKHTMTFMCVIDSAAREGSAKLYTSTERLEIGSQWKDLDIPALTAGSLVSDLNIPTTLTDFAADGAIHVEPDANNEVSIANDITRHKQAIVVHDPHIYTGDPSSPTDHLIGWWKCNDNADSTTVAATVGSDATWGGNTSVDSVDGLRGGGLDTQGARYLTLPSDIDESFLAKGSLVLTVIPQFDSAGVNQGLVYLRSSTGNNRLDFRFIDGGSAWTFLVRWNSVDVTLDDVNEVSDECLYRPTVIMLSWDSDSKAIFYSINGRTGFAQHSENCSETTGALSVSKILSDRYDSTIADVILDELCIYDGCILPFGAYFTGNGSVDASVAHGDVLFYWDCDSISSPVAQIAGGSGSITIEDTTGVSLVTGVDGTANSAIEIANAASRLYVPSSGNINSGKGACSFWFKASGAPDTYATIFSHSTADFYFRREDTSFLMNIGGSLCYLTDTWQYVSDGNWHFVRINWNDTTNVVNIWIDGVSRYSRTNQTFTGPDVSTGNLYIGNRSAQGHELGGTLDKFYITSDPNTPQIPTVFGQPVLAPMIKVA